MLKLKLHQTSDSRGVQKKRISLYVNGALTLTGIVLMFQIFPLPGNQVAPSPEFQTPTPQRSPQKNTSPARKVPIPVAPSAYPSPNQPFTQPVIINMGDNSGNINFGTQETGVYNNYNKSIE